MDHSTLRNNAQKRFGYLLRELCEMSGFTQGKLAREAKAERKFLIENQQINPGDLLGSMEQPTISRVMAGTQEPTYFQVLIWLQVLQRHYESQEFAHVCQKMGIETPEFSDERRRLLWMLAGFVPPGELLKVYEESKQVAPLEFRSLDGHQPVELRSMIDHKETRLSSRYVTDVQFPVLRRSEGNKDTTDEFSPLPTEKNV